MNDMLNWVRCSDRMPDDVNAVNNYCLIRTIHDQYFFAYYSVGTGMWRRIELPFKFNGNKVLDELIKPKNVVAWLPAEDIKMKDEI